MLKSKWIGVLLLLQKTKRKKDNENIEQDVNYLNSFYLDDLDRLSMQSKKAHAFGDINDVFRRPLVHSDRIDLLENHQAMQVLVSAEKFTQSARWPNAPDKPFGISSASSCCSNRACFI